jgi:D-sedoheptulose 7-phosphate isomerase
MQKILAESFKDAAKLIDLFCENPENLPKVELLSEKFAEAFQKGNKLLICGNGGSACDAMHFAEEFTGRYRQDRRALPVIHLGDSGHVTCVANDYGYEEVFARGVEAYGKKGDWLIGLSTSGNSKNIIRAFEKAEEQGLHTLALLGKEGGLLKGRCHYELIIPGKTADRIQEVHMTILHILIEGVERILFPENYQKIDKMNVNAAYLHADTIHE